MTRIIIGISIIVAGFLIVWKTRSIVGLLGRSSFGERYFSGGTFTFYKLVGIAVIIVGVIVLVGLQNELAEGTLGRLYN